MKVSVFTDGKLEDSISSLSLHTHTHRGRCRQSNRSSCFNASQTVSVTRLKLIKALEDVSQSLKHRNMRRADVTNLITQIRHNSLSPPATVHTVHEPPASHNKGAVSWYLFSSEMLSSSAAPARHVNAAWISIIFYFCERNILRYTCSLRQLPAVGGSPHVSSFLQKTHDS